MFNYKLISFSRLIFGLLHFVYWIIYIFKLFKYLTIVLKGKIIIESPFLLFIIWPISGPESQRYSHPLNWYSHTILWYWRGDFYVLQATNLQINPQSNILLTILDLLAFLHIAIPTTSHYYQCKILFTIVSSEWKNHDKKMGGPNC